MESSKFLYNLDLGLGLPLFEQRGFYFTSPEDLAPSYSEITSSEDLKNVSKIFIDLSAIDWSFTKDDTGFLTHDLHPYPAKFIPQIPGNIISRLSLRGELVFDPFGGSGTTALEAIRLGRRAISADANPIATLIGKVKTCNLNANDITDLHSIRCLLTAKLNELPEDPAILCNENSHYIPEIPNIDKWFPLSSRGELAFIRSRIDSLDSENGKMIAELALSKIVLKASFQDSETRYASKSRIIPAGDTIKRFLVALDEIIRGVKQTQSLIRFGVSDFITADIRSLSPEIIKDQAIDLIITSPPYGNANDYHLYHRFRLLWLGYNPRELAKVEIGSHLRHQKEATGFEAYLDEITESLQSMHRVLKHGRFAVLVIGDAIYDDVLYDCAEAVSRKANFVGFETVCIIERQIHKTKRSFVAPGRRAEIEKILVLRKPPSTLRLRLLAPPYRLWQYENILRTKEAQNILKSTSIENEGSNLLLSIDPYTATRARKLVFTHEIEFSKGSKELTWQAIIENGFATQPGSRKDPKYVTHGLHDYKGKFYPQLARSLINLCDLKEGSIILDPFCGSGTTILESYLNGHQGLGCDMHPLATKIARAKVGILDINPDLLREAIGTLLRKIETAPAKFSYDRSEFIPECVNEIENWFPQPVVDKLNWLMRVIRNVSNGIICDFFEVILSDIIREVSHQEPSDLRIRRRKILLEDADVFGLFSKGLITQYERIERFWSVRGYAPNKFFTSKVIEGDSRNWSCFEKLDIIKDSVDMVLTSPPYATALPYIDTDRLSLLVLFGLDSSKRRPLEHELIGSREIITSERKFLEEQITSDFGDLPNDLVDYLIEIFNQVTRADVGFRRKNMPALLLRFFKDMQIVINNCYEALKRDGEAMIVIGDNRIKIDGDYERISTTNFIQAIAEHCGFTTIERIDISVTTENLVHIKNAITENVVLRVTKP